MYYSKSKNTQDSHFLFLSRINYKKYRGEKCPFPRLFFLLLISVKGCFINSSKLSGCYFIFLCHFSSVHITFEDKIKKETNILSNKSSSFKRIIITIRTFGPNSQHVYTHSETFCRCSYHSPRNKQINY